MKWYMYMFHKDRLSVSEGLVAFCCLTFFVSSFYMFKERKARLVETRPFSILKEFQQICPWIHLEIYIWPCLHCFQSEPNTVHWWYNSSSLGIFPLWLVMLGRAKRSNQHCFLFSGWVIKTFAQKPLTALCVTSAHTWNHNLSLCALALDLRQSELVLTYIDSSDWHMIHEQHWCFTVINVIYLQCVS